MTRDTMYLICLPNDAKAKLVKANVIMAKNMNDVPLSKKGSVPSTKKAESGYDHVYHVLKCDYTPLAETVKTYSNAQSFHLTDPYIESPGKPPNFSS